MASSDLDDRGGNNGYDTFGYVCLLCLARSFVLHIKSDVFGAICLRSVFGVCGYDVDDQLFGGLATTINKDRHLVMDERARTCRLAI